MDKLDKQPGRSWELILAVVLLSAVTAFAGYLLLVAKAFSGNGWYMVGAVGAFACSIALFVWGVVEYGRG